MAMVCPRCATTHDQRSQCPGCGIALEFSDGQPSLSANPASRWQHSPWGRILIGLLLAQGLFYGLRHLVAGLLLALHGSAEPPDETSVLVGVILIQLLQAVTLVAGGILTGSGQRNGALLGGVVGVWNGVLTGLTPQFAGQGLSTVALFGDPVLQLALGALAGWLGGAIWKPLALPGPAAPRQAPRKTPRRPRPPLFAGPIAPMRIIFGTLLAVGGCLCAAALFELIDRLSAGDGVASDSVVDLVVTWEIKALALIAGGTLAGSNSYNGLKQGLWVGIFTTLILAALESRSADRWLGVVGLLFISSTALCLAGGWFGSQLLPPVVPTKNRSLESSAMV
jgi:hypothetical protein